MFGFGWKVLWLGLLLLWGDPGLAAAMNSATIVATVDAVSPNPMDVAWDGRTFYYVDSSNGNLYRLNPLTWQSSSFPLDEGVHGVTFDGKNLWVMSTNEQSLLMVSPVTGRVLGSYPIPSATAAGLAYGEGMVWISESTEHLLYLFDPSQGIITETRAMPADMLLHGLAYRDGVLYGIDVTGNAIVALDADDLSTLATYPVPTRNCHGMGWVRLLGEDLLVVSDKVGKKFYFIRLND